jgi:hypothetical protein
VRTLPQAGHCGFLFFMHHDPNYMKKVPFCEMFGIYALILLNSFENCAENTNPKFSGAPKSSSKQGFWESS